MKNIGSGLVTDVVFAGNLRIGKIESGVSYFYHLDHLGSIRQVTNNLVASTFITKYKPYGTSFATSGSERFKYTGKQFDQSSGLYYYGYRYYDSQVGRFITPDNHRPQYLNPQSLNRYSYALNSPNRYADPDGRMFDDVNDNGARVAGGIEAVTGRGFDHSRKGPDRSTLEMMRQISLLETGLPPGLPNSLATTTTTTGSSCIPGKQVIQGITGPVSYWTRPLLVVALAPFLVATMGPLGVVAIASMLATWALATYINQQANQNCPG